MTGEVVDRGRECVSWAEVVPNAVAVGWAKTFGMRPSLGAFKCLVYSGRMWPLLAGHGMLACPHGFCIMRTRPGGGSSSGPVAQVCSIPDSAEACSCMASVPKGDGWCYLDGFEQRDARTAAALLLKSPTVEDILALCPGYGAKVSWDGDASAHVERPGRYALVDLPPEVIVGGRATCRALGYGHLLSEYCESCSQDPAVSEGKPLTAACGTGPCVTGDSGYEGLRVAGGASVDQLVLTGRGAGCDALWVRTGVGPDACSVIPVEGQATLVGACGCESSLGAGAVGLLPSSLQGGGLRWRKLGIGTRSGWSVLCRAGETIVVQGGYLVCKRPTVVYHQGPGIMMVWTDRVWFSVVAHSRVQCRQVRHRQFNVGGFTHWKVLCKADPDCVWKPVGVQADVDTRGVTRARGGVSGLGPLYEVDGSVGACAVRASVADADYGFIVTGGYYELVAHGFSVAPQRSVWVFLGGTRSGSLSLEENRWRLRDVGVRGSVIALEDDYELDDGGPSSDEEDASVGELHGE
jgi:hypothetical protein